MLTGDPYGTRTRVSAVKGQRPRPLDEGTNRVNGGLDTKPLAPGQPIFIIFLRRPDQADVIKRHFNLVIPGPSVLFQPSCHIKTPADAA